MERTEAFQLEAARRDAHELWGIPGNRLLDAEHALLEWARCPVGGGSAHAQRRAAFKRAWRVLTRGALLGA